MVENRDDLMSIVVLEAGASWPSWLTEYQRSAPNAVVIAQAESESPDIFGRRVLHRVEEAASLELQKVRVGVLVSRGFGDHPTLVMRDRLARALLRVMMESGRGELVLAGDGTDGDAARHQLFGLAGSLCEELGGTKVNVRVRFAHKSGVMRSVTPPALEIRPEPEMRNGNGAEPA
jgi:hypothetical protein